MYATHHNPNASDVSANNETVSTSDDWAEENAAQQLIAFLMSADPAEMDCRELLDVIARYVDLEAASGGPPIWMPSVDVHLDACDHCHELYAVLRYLALRGDALDPDLEQLWERVRAEAGSWEMAGAETSSP